MSFRLYKRGLSVSICLLVALCAHALAAEGALGVPTLSASAIVERLMAANARRAMALREYQGRRTYHLDYHGLFGTHEADMQVEATYSAPGHKQFRIISESGSRLLINRVLVKLLSSEQDAQNNRQELEISPRNYDFALDGIEHLSGADYYVLDVTPKSRSKYVYRGKIWVDAHDFAVERMQGEPAKNPSIWVSHVAIEYKWAKVAGFWLPVENESITDVRLGGKAKLTIGYSDYQVGGVDRTARGRPADHPNTLPDPATVTADPH